MSFGHYQHAGKLILDARFANELQQLALDGATYGTAYLDFGTGAGKQLTQVDVTGLVGL